jgi:putative endonuclease
MRDHIYFVYMLASQPQGTLYTGVTNDVLKRARQHRDGVVSGFTKKYGVKKLVWFETHGDIREAIAREKQIKRWRRDWKRSLIEKDNPHWADLYPGLLRSLTHTTIDETLIAPIVIPDSVERADPEPAGTSTQ